MRTYEGEGLGDVYFKMLRDLTENGRKHVINRKGTCLEFPEPTAFTFEKPGYCWMQLPELDSNPFAALEESVSLCRSNVDTIAGAVSALIAQASDTRSLALNIQDNWSRNCVIYSQRGDVLEQTVVINTSDALFELPSAAVRFSHLHAFTTGFFGPQMKMGRFTLIVNGLYYCLDQHKPTLSTVLGSAYDTRKMWSQCVANFDGISPVDFQQGVRTIDEIDRLGAADVSVDGHGYFGHTVPLMLWIYNLLQHRQVDNFELVADKIRSLPQPFRYMVLKFYADVDGPAKEVLSYLNPPAMDQASSA